MLKINSACEEFAFSVHFISLSVDDLNLVDSCNCRHWKKRANPTKQKRGVNGVINQFGIGILIIVEY